MSPYRLTSACNSSAKRTNVKQCRGARQRARRITHTTKIKNLDFTPQNWYIVPEVAFLFFSSKHYTSSRYDEETPPEKRWKQRKTGILKIVHKMQQDFGIRLSFYMERNGFLLYGIEY